jgi:hypothetical protein
VPRHLCTQPFLWYGVPIIVLKRLGLGNHKSGAPLSPILCCDRTAGQHLALLRDHHIPKKNSVLSIYQASIMGSLRTLFLGVYSSQSIIRTLFLPTCYVLLFSPFLTLAGYYLGFGQKLNAYIPEDLSWFDFFPQIALVTVLILLPTRLLSALGTSANKYLYGKRRIQPLPYWIPGFRHFWNIATGGEAWLKSVR